jgi:signal transduction histidine kinase
MVAVSFHGASYRAPAVRAALETMTTLFAFAAAWLLRAQFTHSRRYRDLLLGAGAATLGVANLAANAVPAALELPPRAQFVAMGLWWQLLVGGILAAAAFSGSDHVLPQRRVITAAGGLSVAAVLAAGLAGLLLSGAVVGHTTSGTQTSVLSHPMGLALAVLGSALLAFAAAGFLRRDFAISTPPGTTLAVGAFLLAGASAYHLASSSLAPERLTPGVGLRSLACAFFLLAAVRTELQSRARLAKAAALAERQRVARDLHDGLAQDLALIAAHGRSFAGEMGEDHPVVIAAERALAISREAISELSNHERATTGEALEAVAHELAERFELAVAVDAQPDAEVGPEARGHLTRIAREAIANAARHGGARNVIVSLTRGDSGVALRVVDDGCGIHGNGGVPSREGFGLRSMHERAAGLGGRLTVDQAAGGGTELEVVLP